MDLETLLLLVDMGLVMCHGFVDKGWATHLDFAGKDLGRHL